MLLMFIFLISQFGVAGIVHPTSFAMAKTKADTKNTAKSPKTKSKAKVKSEPKKPVAPRKRKADSNSNPFDLPPDVGQASIMKFTQNQKTQPSAVSPPNDAPVDHQVHVTDAKDIAVEHDPQDGHMDLDKTVIPEVYLNLSRGPHINLSEIVVTTREKTTGPVSVWRPILGDFVRCLSEDEVNLLVTQCKNHPQLDEHVKTILATCGITGEEWTFAGPEGDVLEDVEEMIVWLVSEEHSNRVKSTPMTESTPMEDVLTADNATTANTASPEAGQFVGTKSIVTQLYILCCKN